MSNRYPPRRVNTGPMTTVAMSQSPRFGCSGRRQSTGQRLPEAEKEEGGDCAAHRDDEARGGAPLGSAPLPPIGPEIRHDILRHSIRSAEATFSAPPRFIG